MGTEVETLRFGRFLVVGLVTWTLLDSPLADLLKSFFISLSPWSFPFGSRDSPPSPPLFIFLDRTRLPKSPFSNLEGRSKCLQHER